MQTAYSNNMLLSDQNNYGMSCATGSLFGKKFLSNIILFSDER